VKIRQAGLNNALSVALVAAILAYAVVVVHREFFERPPEPPVPPPEYVTEWRAIHSAGVDGDTSAPVQIVEFFDLQCPACQAYDTVLQRVVKRFRGRVALRYVHLPLPIHKHALSAARASECARAQRRFREFVSVIFAHQHMLGNVSYRNLARDAGIRDLDAFDRCSADTAAVPAVEAGRHVAERFDVHSTPTILVNGWRYRGLPGERTLQRFLTDLGKNKVAAPLPPAQASVVVVPRRRVEAGVVNLEHSATAFGLAPQLSVEPSATMVAGGVAGDPSYDLTGVRHVKLLSDGRIAALNQQVPAVMIFAADGRPQLTIGRRGAGPGEFRGANDLARLNGDTLLLLDLGNLRMNWLLPGRGLVRFEPIDGRIPEGASRIAGAFPDGRIVLTSAGRVERAVPGSRTRSLASLVVLRTGARGQTIARVPDVETVTMETRYEGQRGAETLPLRFSRLAHVAVWDTILVVATGENYRLDFRNSAGRLFSTISVDRSRRPVTWSMIQVAIKEQIERLASYRERPRDPAESQRLIREGPSADSLPPYDNVFVSPGTLLWVLDPVAPTDTAWSATAFRHDGAIVARVRAPVRRGLPIAFADSTVLLRQADSDGIVSFSLHRLLPSGQGAASSSRGRR
jgi:predicted DsbA family dithiol-disulfide isomerase